MIPLVGFGYDIHRFSTAPRPLVLGGVCVHDTRGLDGHSDADVLCHALADAILGAIGEPDIGHWFPPTDPACAGICSLRIVEKAVELLRAREGKIGNADCTVIAEAPRILPHVPAMKDALSPVLGVVPTRIGIKATTNEKLGSIGRGEGIAAFATVCVLLPE